MSSHIPDKNKDFSSAGDAFPQCEDNLQHGELSNRLHRVPMINSFIFAAIPGACKADIDPCLSPLQAANELTAHDQTSAAQL